MALPNLQDREMGTGVRVRGWGLCFFWPDDLTLLELCVWGSDLGYISCQQLCFVLHVWTGGIEMSVLASALPAAKSVPGLVLSLFFRNLGKPLKALIPYVLQ